MLEGRERKVDTSRSGTFIPDEVGEGQGGIGFFGRVVDIVVAIVVVSSSMMHVLYDRKRVLES